MPSNLIIKPLGTGEHVSTTAGVQVGKAPAADCRRQQLDWPGLKRKTARQGSHEQKTRRKRSTKACPGSGPGGIDPSCHCLALWGGIATEEVPSAGCGRSLICPQLAEIGDKSAGWSVKNKSLILPKSSVRWGRPNRCLPPKRKNRLIVPDRYKIDRTDCRALGQGRGSRPAGGARDDSTTSLG